MRVACSPVKRDQLFKRGRIVLNSTCLQLDCEGSPTLLNMADHVGQEWTASIRHAGDTIGFQHYIQKHCLRDWSLTTGTGEGGYKMKGGGELSFTSIKDKGGE